MFKNHNGEETVVKRLRALVEEFSGDRVVVALPTAWTNPNYYLGAVVLEFNTKNSIDISVPEYGIFVSEPLMEAY